ncbi:hypothetical protein CJI97_004881 [Candidozyma auris]|uniref:RFX-type winged-helix domain-containing protein n=1 Tax=Candidozyma auris TaxID=498019 RepID=A0A2H0ZFW3_CANAR|nr:hypothetical protein QG37_03761 [[Candida] auris]PIS49547.1 hypothetical protein B9J08_004571 [[Candida] auris]PIS50191.1 hypothetical protein CJI97_004881 [[Candida] auris]QRG39967.1 hypothetical protein FDK38_004428 [[Candida] auris]
MPSLVPIQGVSKIGVSADGMPASYAGGTLGNNSELHGAGHMGIGPLDRIIMSLESGLESEIEYALSTLTYYSCNEPKLLDFTSYSLMGRELIKYFIRPYHLIIEGKENEVRAEMMSLSCESLLSLRNAVQDLHNQQWLCQRENFRKFAAEALKFLSNWFYAPGGRKSHLSQFSELFRESFLYLLDTLDPLTCFYTNTSKNDSLFHTLLYILSHTSDRYVLLNTIKCLYHLLFVKTSETASKGAEDEETTDTSNCIDALSGEHLSIIVRTLMVNDDELTHATLSFLRQYLTSEALHAQYPTSVEASQRHRSRKLMHANSSTSNMHILLKQLPELIVAKLPLIDPHKFSSSLPVTFTKRSTYAGIPLSTPKLPKKLYNIIINFPEPLRATTWLRCCYEPYTQVTNPEDNTKDVAAGEVTQISLWKAYENQFEAIWKERLNPNWPNLLPAVEFIKNVSSAFPNSEAMVVNLPQTDPGAQPKKKFIIKGIQPRQFPVSVEVGNFEALRSIPATAEEKHSPSAPIGHIDVEAFEAALAAKNESLLQASVGLSGPEDTSAPWHSPINGVARDVLGKIVEELLEPDTDGVYKNVFRQYNRDWLPDLVYVNPGLVEQEYINGQWLSYLL